MHSVTIKYEKPMVTIPLEEYEEMQETIDILSSKSLMREIRKALKDAREGKTIPWEEVKRRMGWDED
jgi:PHD/YefM family antitoxin component YafN of YafNO toxin-antitoxin module